MMNYEDAYKRLIDTVAQMREYIYMQDGPYVDEHLAEMVSDPQACLELIFDWIKHGKN